MFSDVFVVDRPGVNVYIVFERVFMVFYGKPLQTMIFQRFLGKSREKGGGGTGKYQIDWVSYSRSKP